MAAARALLDHLGRFEIPKVDVQIGDENFEMS